jgi:uncharacterized linocin/CFP29 family protein
MDHLYRDLAPIAASAWDQIEDEARTRLTTYLAARKLVDFEGPHGWAHSATDLGRTAPVDPPGAGLTARRRRVLPLVELRADFGVSRDEIEDASRGAADMDLSELDDAVKRIAVAENAAIFHGYAAGGIAGITEASSHSPLPLPSDFTTLPTTVARAVNALLGAGIDGPYGLAIGPEGYTTIVESTENGGHLLLDHLRHILGGPLVWAPGVVGAVVLSMRGGDFVLDVGQDLSIGYRQHDAVAVQLYVEESFSFRVVDPDAAIALTAAAASRSRRR